MITIVECNGFLDNSECLEYTLISDILNGGFKKPYWHSHGAAMMRPLSLRISHSEGVGFF